MSDKLKTLKEILATVTSASVVSLCTETKVTLQGGKANAFQGRVTKRSVGSSVMVFANNDDSYVNIVRRRLAAEGKDPEAFERQERRWGKPVDGTPFIEHGGEYYLEVVYLREGATEYMVDGKPLAEGELIPGLPASPRAGNQGGLDDKVVVRTYKVSSIREISVDKKHYMLD